jgi:hypothetical protein
MSDWSQVSTDDLITIHHTFESRSEREDGMVTIELNPVAWSRCYAIMYEIAHEFSARQDRQ